MRFLVWTECVGWLVLSVAAGCGQGSGDPWSGNPRQEAWAEVAACPEAGCTEFEAFGDVRGVEPDRHPGDGVTGDGRSGNDVRAEDASDPDPVDGPGADADAFAPEDGEPTDIMADGLGEGGAELPGGDSAELPSGDPDIFLAEPADSQSSDAAWDFGPSTDLIGEETILDDTATPDVFDAGWPELSDLPGLDLQDGGGDDSTSNLTDVGPDLTDVPPVEVAGDLGTVDGGAVDLGTVDGGAGGEGLSDQWDSGPTDLAPDLAWDVQAGDVIEDSDSGGVDLPLPPFKIEFMTVEQSSAMVLGVRVRYYTTVAASGSLTVLPPDGEAAWHVDEPYGVSDTLHQFLVPGLKPGKTYTFQAEAEDELGEYASFPFVEYVVGNVPKDLPEVQLTFYAPAKKAPGLTYVSLMRWTPVQDPQWGYTVAYDDAGQVRWYTPNNCIDFHFMASGDMLCVAQGNRLMVLNRIGETVHLWTPFNIGIDSIHHSAIELPDGNLVLMSTELRTIGGYPAKGGGTATYKVVGDVIVETTPWGSKVKEWKLLDMLDPYTYTSGFDVGYWDGQYPGQGGTKDWSHGNGVFYDELADELIVSLRHQSLVVGMGRSDGLLHWKFGEGGDFSLEQPGEYQVWQHSPKLTKNRTLMVFDNGNLKPEGPYSRAVEYELGKDGVAIGPWQAKQIWEFTDDEPFFSAILGEVDELENGNILVTDSSRVDHHWMDRFSPANPKWARVVEVTRDSPAQKVFELRVPAEGCKGAKGYWIPKSERAPLPLSGPVLL